MERVTNVINGKFSSNKVVVDNRKKVTLTGVERALGSNESAICLVVCGNKFYISGQKLEIEKLDIENGLCEVSGTIDSIKFAGKSQGNIFKRIFK